MLGNIKTVFNDPNYWIGRLTGTKYSWGYSNYLESEVCENNILEGDNFAFNGRLKILWDRLQGQDFTNAKVLEIGGATGYLSKIAKHYFPQITYDMIDISTYWIGQNKIEPTINNFFNVDVMTKATEGGQGAIKNNAYDVIISRLVLECLTDQELAILIPKLNAWCRVKQIHFFSDPVNYDQASKDANAYNGKTLQQWASMGFESGTILQDTNGNEVIV